MRCSETLPVNRPVAASTMENVAWSPSPQSPPRASHSAAVVASVTEGTGFHCCTSGSVSIARASAESSGRGGRSSQPPTRSSTGSIAISSVIARHPSSQLTAEQAADPGVLSLAAVQQPAPAGALDGEAHPFGNLAGADVADGRPPLDPLQVQLVEGPPTDQAGGSCGHPAAPRPRSGPEPDLAHGVV